ncbi:SUMF1/EgtB/PvdO family nonheme iron enzyme [Crocosphaera sp. XPORK-15E]|uniref:SUMF1/EgtB/PvdO family nonheme iron enzyme n=1 Tax=Crocosphaera sp. XPORK-15E TaxID=3110247 RepID=UPI002B205968|nr:SUMF1/EgtB/PvdO family nonheme iron enzyme [Crocosphaera sp. XPORK-15E]MEA5536838.1 SUMF1/EgtB/PvdO family nonheme iron enzyme [Crocosphaera sp. XPORK-15E]
MRKRGGSWINDPNNCRCANRNNNNPRDNNNNNVGFRVVRSSPSTPLYQNWQMGICRACQRRVQICSGDV